MKLSAIKIDIQKPTLYGELVKNGTLLILSNAINDVKDGYFEAIFIAILKALGSSKRRKGA
jgi:hypothetical protein